VFHKPDNTVLARFDSFAEMARMTRDLFANMRTVHQTHDAEIAFISDTEADAIWSMEDWHVHAPQDGRPAQTMHGCGFSHETWRRIDGQWRIERLELRRVVLDFA
jgi:SnoaL-like domain